MDGEQRKTLKCYDTCLKLAKVKIKKLLQFGSMVCVFWSSSVCINVFLIKQFWAMARKLQNIVAIFHMVGLVGCRWTPTSDCNYEEK